MYIRHPNGAEVSGEVLEVTPPRRLVFTYGMERGEPSPPGSSRVTITLDPHADGTLLHLVHEFADAAVRDNYVQGWRYQLSLFANVVAASLDAHAGALVDRWFAAWSEPDAGARERALSEIVSNDIRFADRYSHIAGLEDLRPHLAAVHRFMPGLRLERQGDIRHCQWRVLADWRAVRTDGTPQASGTNLFELDAAGRIAAVTGFWSQ
jgi:hypothetical protein